jgi:hypothetical protein
MGMLLYNDNKQDIGEKSGVEERKIVGKWLQNLIYEGRDWTMGWIMSSTKSGMR